MSKPQRLSGGSSPHGITKGTRCLASAGSLGPIVGDPATSSRDCVTDLARKLLLKPGYRVLMLHLPPDVQTRLASAELIAETTPSGGPYDGALLFADARAAAERELSPMLREVTGASVVWLAYRKVPRGDLNRPGVWEISEPLGWLPVSQVAIDSNWSAMRLRPRADIGMPTTARRR